MPKTIEYLNRLMTTEYQRLGPLAWIRTDDKRLFMPCIEEEIRDGMLQPVYENYQTATGLWIVKPVVKLQPLMPKFQGGETEPPIWCLCHQQHVDEDIWKHSFGSLEDYVPIQWVPTFTDKHQVIPLHLTSEPDEEDTWAMIHFLRSTSEPVKGQFSYEYKRAADRIAKKQWDANKYEVAHTVGALGRVVHEPGTKSSGVSYPAKETHAS